MMTPLLIIDYGMGNLRSVANAFKSIGCGAVISKNPQDMKDAKRIVLPGVGAFGNGMANLQAAGWVDALNEEIIIKRKPFLGLCLGMQLLVSKGFEHGIHDGLNWVEGDCVKFSTKNKTIRVPHMGWNDVKFTHASGLYAGLGNSQTFYFVHSFYVKLKDEMIASGVCEYGDDFVASIEKDNIYATQFHPEKSQTAGLAVLNNFLRLTE